MLDARPKTSPESHQYC